MKTASILTKPTTSREKRAATRPGSEALRDVDLPAQVSVIRPFFLAGIFSVLTTGCLLGAVALYGIAQRASYTTTAMTPYVLAHANSQLFGWVGLFVMGYALQIHPPRRSKARLYHVLAAWSLGLIAVGIALRFLAEPLVQQNRGLWLPIGVLSGILQALAVLLFIANSGMTRAKTIEESTGKPSGLPWQSLFVFASLGWWLAVSAVEPIVFALSHQPDKTTSILFVAKWFVPYREAQFLGFAVNMIFGVGLARFASYFGVFEADRKLGLAGFALWNGGLLVRMVGWIISFNAGMQPGSEWTYYVGGLLLAAGALYLVGASRVFERASEWTGPTLFVRAALAWLLVAGVLFVLEPLHLRAIGAPFSHAYTGSIRHALTVGFISQMILGVSSRVVPRLRNQPEMPLAASWAVFLLLNIGNTGRVALELVTDYTPAGFAPMGITGFVELTALIIWAAAIVRALLFRPANESIRQSADAGLARI